MNHQRSFTELTQRKNYYFKQAVSIFTRKIHCFVIVLDQWTKAIDYGFYIDVIYCNSMKASDKLPHKRVLKILKYYYIPSKIGDLIKSLLTNKKQS